MSQTLVRLEAGQDMIIEKLLALGLFKTKSEVIRAGVLELGKEYKIFKNAQEIEDQMVVRKLQQIDNQIKKGKIKLLSHEKVSKKYGFK